MPNNDESFFDPTDLAMFASNRASVPLMSLLYSKEANAGQDAERFARQVEYDRAMAERRRDAAVQRAMALHQQRELDARVPPEVQRWYMNRNYDPATATRRADYEQLPQRRFGSPGSEMRATPRGYAGGGGVRKTVQQMADELLAKGTRTAAKDAPDIGRRALFGLRPQLDLPLARIHPDIEKAAESRLAKALKNAPQETTKSVEVNPATGSIKSTLQSVANTPLSRRTVLSATAGQALRRMIPGLDALAPGVGDVLPDAAKLAESVAGLPANSAIASGIPGLIASGLSAGMHDEDIVRMVVDAYRHKAPTSGKIEEMVNSIKDPTSVSFDEPVGAGRAMMDMIGVEGPPLANRSALRYMQKVAPDKYGELRQTAKDMAEFGFE